MKLLTTWMQDAVRSFAVAIDEPAPDRLALHGVREELRANLILEEAMELLEALGFVLRVDYRENGDTVDLRVGGVVRVGEPNWPRVAHEMCDLLYVTFGLAVEAGFRIEPFFAEVHDSNMTKAGGPRREDGKVLKPEGYRRPQIGALWEHVQAQAERGVPTALVATPL